jgi:hypothetical protein
MFYMGILFTTLKEVNIKWFVKNCYSPQRLLWQNCHIILFYVFNVFLSYALCTQIIAKFIECMIKGRNSHGFIFISCILMPQNYIRSGKSCQKYAIFTLIFFKFKRTFSTLHNLYLFNYMLWFSGLCHKHQVVLFMFTLFFTLKKSQL